MTDAMGYDIEVGQLYGYSNRSNGIVTVTVGEVLGFTNKGVTLRVLKRGEALYTNPIEREVGHEGKKANVAPNSIFRLQNDHTEW